MWYLEASRDLAPGAEILREPALVAGPKQVTTPVCLGCYKPLTAPPAAAASSSSSNSRDDHDTSAAGADNKDSSSSSSSFSWCSCPGCGWPLCSLACATAACHAESGECDALSRGGGGGSGERGKPPVMVKFKDASEPCPQYECIIVLRALLLRERDPLRWRLLMLLQSHDNAADAAGNEEEGNGPCVEDSPPAAAAAAAADDDGGIQRPPELVHYINVNIVSYIRDHLHLGDIFSGDIVRRVAGIVDINAFELKDGDRLYCGVFFMSAMMAHSCVVNTSHSLFLSKTDAEQQVQRDDDEEQQVLLVIRATVPIPHNASIVTSYAPALDGTLARRPHLLRAKLFACTCARCADPTELDTLFGAIRCCHASSGCTGALISEQPLDDMASWACSNAPDCDARMSVDDVLKAVDDVTRDVEKAGEDVVRLEQVLKTQRALADTHYVVFGVKASLAQLYGRVPRFLLRDLPAGLLKRKEQLCREVLDVLRVLEPGFSRMRGLLLYEFHAAVLMRVNALFDGDASPAECLPLLVEARAALAESALILGMEPARAVEGRIGRTAASQVAELDDWIHRVGAIV
ncbi:unnamed protein product [Notodromas monacha]|uniref:SET domain-containing protein n=1 Tax=Notodromas monacha TaxID=399045 RepID=A0A7R9GCZ4_9CRUS|nr:unnamed protein product [Notodromas monacha]CAG0916454.1 unnamed protein product [Notodromas monacha]